MMKHNPGRDSEIYFINIIIMSYICILTDSDAYFYPLHPFVLLSLIDHSAMPSHLGWPGMFAYYEINCIRD